MLNANLARLGLIVVACALGCSKPEVPSAPPSPPAAAPAAQAPSFANKTFAMSFQEGAPLLTGVPVTLSFRDANLGLNAGCNELSADYRVTAGVLEVTDVASTRRGCSAEGHERDTWLGTFLKSRPQLQLAGPRLTLKTDSARLVFADSSVPQ